MTGKDLRTRTMHPRVRWLATGTASVFLLCLLCACGGGAAQATPASSPSSAPQQWWLSEPYIRAAVSLYEPRTEACCREALLRDTRFDAARMLVAFSVAPSGDVSAVRVLESTVVDAVFDACMVHAYHGLHFPPGPDKGVRLELPVRFSRRRL